MPPAKGKRMAEFQKEGVRNFWERGRRRLLDGVMEGKKRENKEGVFYLFF